MRQNPSKSSATPSDKASTTAQGRLRAIDISDEEVFSLYATVRAVNRRFKASQVTQSPGHPQPLSDGDVEAIFVIGEHGSCTAGHLAKSISVPATTATTIVDRLVARKLVSRTRSEQDRRSVWLTLTKSGTAILAHARQDLLRVCRAALAALNPTERKSFARLLQKISTTEQ